MFSLRLKYYFFCSFLIFVLCLKAQNPNDGSQAVINIIGDEPVQSNNASDFINTNPYPTPKEPPGKHQKLQEKQIIEPSLENGFHVRFEMSYDQPFDQGGGASISSGSGDGSTKVKKRGKKLIERSINTKKRIRRWFPARKKKYRPTMCGRF